MTMTASHSHVGPVAIHRTERRPMQDRTRVVLLSVATFACQAVPIIVLGLRVGPPLPVLGAAALLWAGGTICGIWLFVMFVEQPSRLMRAAGFVAAVGSTILSIALVFRTVLAT